MANIQDILDRFTPPTPTSLGAFLRSVQSEFNWVSPQALHAAADHFQLPYTKVYEQAAFSFGLCLEERGAVVLEVCQGLACREAGSRDLLLALEKGTGLKTGQTSADGHLSLCQQSCFGRCAIGPNVRLKGIFHAGQTPDQADRLLEIALQKS
jgi:NADH:ubiquinone oxidoreductase subunit E